MSSTPAVNHDSEELVDEGTLLQILQCFRPVGCQNCPIVFPLLGLELLLLLNPLGQFFLHGLCWNIPSGFC